MDDKTKPENNPAGAEAVRYRWLRDNNHLNIWWSVDGPKDRCANIDADIDAAMNEAANVKLTGAALLRSPG